MNVCVFRAATFAHLIPAISSRRTAHPGPFRNAPAAQKPRSLRVSRVRPTATTPNTRHALGQEYPPDQA